LGRFSRTARLNKRFAASKSEKIELLSYIFKRDFYEAFAIQIVRGWKVKNKTKETLNLLHQNLI